MQRESELPSSETCQRIARIADDYFREKAARPYGVSLESYVLQLPEEDRSVATELLEMADRLCGLTKEHSDVMNEEAASSS